MAEDETLDSAGRLRVAKHLLEHGELEGRCVVVGVDDHLEVWSPERWDDQVERMEKEASAVAEVLAGWPAEG